MTALLAIIAIPYWEQGYDVLSFYGSPSGVFSYVSRQIDYQFTGSRNTRDLWSSKTSSLGLTGGIRRNEWGVEANYINERFTKWTVGNQGYNDTTNVMRISIYLNRYASERSATSMGFAVRYHNIKFQHVGDSTAGEVNGNSFGVAIKLFLENPRINEPGRGFTMWLGGYLGLFFSNYKDDNQITAESAVPDINFNAGMKYRPASWWDIYGGLDVTILDASYTIPKNKSAFGDYVKFGLNDIALVAGLTLYYNRTSE